MLHLQGEAQNWWFSHLSHAKVTAYEKFTQNLIKKLDKKKSERKNPSPPSTVEALVSGGRPLAPFQYDLDLLISRVPCIILDMHEGEETCTSDDEVIEAHLSSSEVGEAITLVDHVKPLLKFWQALPF